MKYILRLGTCHAQSNINRETLASGFPDYSMELIVHDLGILLDGELSMVDHVNSFRKKPDPLLVVRHRSYGIIFCSMLP